MRNKLPAILILLLAIAAGISSYIGRQNIAHEMKPEPQASTKMFVTGPDSQNIDITAIPLDVKAGEKVGDLTYVAGWELKANSDHFGGWSGLVMEENGKRLKAISDKGDILTAGLNITGDKVFYGASLAPFPGKTEDNDNKSNFDAESIVASGSGYLVSFEQKHRIMKLDENGVATPFKTGVDFSNTGRNSGIEAFSQEHDGTLLMFAENGVNAQGTSPVWLSKDGQAKDLRFAPPANYSPTDSALDKCGNLFLLMRHYSLINGVSAKVLFILASDIKPGAVLKGQELASLKDPFPVDNMEGLDMVYQEEDGKIRLFLISDDNFNPVQKTLFMVFDWFPTTACYK